jgi:D-glycero-D-manno-heptose 1,7-bisphosphate phosphatase
MRKAAFLDRDGVINCKAAEGEYITCWEQMQLLPGAQEAIIRLNRSGFLVIVVTNQRCVAKALITADALEALHQRMCSDLARAGATIDAVYYCPHDVQPPCGCRKPAPGLLLRAAQEHGIALHESWMIGDSASDSEAGRRAGCKTARVASNSPAAGINADVIGSSLLDVTCAILSHEPFPRTLSILNND